MFFLQLQDACWYTLSIVPQGACGFDVLEVNLLSKVNGSIGSGADSTQVQSCTRARSRRGP